MSQFDFAQEMQQRRTSNDSSSELSSANGGLSNKPMPFQLQAESQQVPQSHRNQSNKTTTESKDDDLSKQEKGDFSKMATPNINVENNSGAVQKKSSDFSRSSNAPVQRKMDNTEGISEGVLQKMENSFGEDFSDVKLFTNSQSAQDLEALAYTQGNEIHFAPGEDPYSNKGQEILGHELSHVIQQREDRVETTHQEQGQNINNNDHLEKEADTQGRKAAQGTKVERNPISTNNQQGRNSPVQKKNAPIQKYASLPTGATIVTINPDFGNIYAACANLAYRIAGGNANNINWARRIGTQLEGAMATNTLSPINMSFLEDNGINFNWNVSIAWRINDPRPIGDTQSGSVTRNSGGSTQSQVGSGTSTQDSAGATGGVSTGGHEGAPGATGGVSVGTQSGTSSSQQNQVTLNGGGSTTTTEQRQTYSAGLVAQITVEGSQDFSGSDWVNPFKWGTTAVNAILVSGPQTGNYSGGTLEYEQRPRR